MEGGVGVKKPIGLKGVPFPNCKIHLTFNSALGNSSLKTISKSITPG